MTTGVEAVRSSGIRIAGVAARTRLLAGLVAVFVVFQWSAHTLGSDRGQAGLIVGALVVAGTIGVERLLFDRSIARAASSLGLGRSRVVGLIVAAGVCVCCFL